MSDIITPNLSVTDARELAIDAVMEKLNSAELHSAGIVRDAELPERALIITADALYIVHASARTRSAVVTATQFVADLSGHDVVKF